MTARTGAVNRDAERGAGGRGGAAGAREHDRHHRRRGHLRRRQQFESSLSKICFDWIKHFEQVDRVTCLALRTSVYGDGEDPVMKCPKRKQTISLS